MATSGERQHCLCWATWREVVRDDVKTTSRAERGRHGNTVVGMSGLYPSSLENLRIVSKGLLRMQKQIAARSGSV